MWGPMFRGTVARSVGWSCADVEARWFCVTKEVSLTCGTRHRSGPHSVTAYLPRQSPQTTSPPGCCRCTKEDGKLRSHPRTGVERETDRELSSLISSLHRIFYNMAHALIRCVWLLMRFPWSIGMASLIYSEIGNIDRFTASKPQKATIQLTIVPV
jgi:hypothetical protein